MEMSEDKKTSRPYGLGRRKTAIARVWLNSGQKGGVVNGREIKDYFGKDVLVENAISPLKATSQDESMGVEAKVLGGGKKSQSDAIKLGAARALLEIDVEWRKQLKHGGFLTRDARIKERKKPGLKRARRAPQFSKR